jgi:hypothetical protein
MQDEVKNIKIDNTSSEKMEQCKYLETTLMNQNYIQEEIKSRLEIRECLLSFGAESILSKYINIKIYRTTILPIFCMGVKLCRSQCGRNAG